MSEASLSVRPASARVTLVQSGTLVGSGELKSQAQVYPQLARSELAVVAKAVGAWQRGDDARVRELNDWVLATRETRELRRPPDPEDQPREWPRIRATIKRLGLNVDELLTGSNMATNKTKTGRR